MMQGRRLSNEISISELQTMRENGMTNEEIAKSLEITQQTVRRYIGNMPKSMWKKRSPKNVELKPVAAPKQEAAPVGRLAVRGMTFTMDGKTSTFTVYMQEGVVEFAGDNLVGTFEIGKLDALIEDIQFAANTISMMKGVN